MIMIRFLFILLLCWNYSIGQPSKDEYIIKYSIGHYNFGNSGEFERNEIFKFKLNGDKFILTEFQSISNKYVYNSKTKKNDRKVSDTITRFPNKKIEKSEIENLVVELTKNQNNFNPNFIKANLPNEMSKKDILKIAKRIEKEYSSLDVEGVKVREFEKERIKEIQNLRYFDQYIKSITPKTDEFIMVSDVWNFAELGYSNATERLDFYSILGQPILKINDTKNNIQIINLNINLILLKILPEQSLLIKEVSFENIEEGYINWYIENMKWDIKD